MFLFQKVYASSKRESVGFSPNARGNKNKSQSRLYKETGYAFGRRIVTRAGRKVENLAPRKRQGKRGKARIVRRATLQ